MLRLSIITLLALKQKSSTELHKMMCHMCVVHLFQLPPTDKNYLPALWGKLASEILMQNWETALDDLNRIKEVIDNNMNNVNTLENLTIYRFIHSSQTCIFCV